VTLVVSNVARLYLVWRFVRIQPFDRHYARLGIPAILGGLAMLGAHLLLDQATWPLDLVVSGVVGSFVYTTALLGVGLAPAERAALKRILGGVSPGRAGSTP
jgi:hypothetical protein